MMRIKNFIYLLLLATGIFLSSCIRDRAQNMEADIETATIANSTELLQVQPVITDNTITFRLREYTTDFNFSPEFTLTPGASIKPASGTKLDFSTPQKYTVTSEDGAWTKEYTVSFVIDNSERRYYPFENAEVIDTDGPEGHFHKFFDYRANGQKNMTGLQLMKATMF